MSRKSYTRGRREFIDKKKEPDQPKRENGCSGSFVIGDRRKEEMVGGEGDASSVTCGRKA